MCRVLLRGYISCVSVQYILLIYVYMYTCFYVPMYRCINVCNRVSISILDDKQDTAGQKRSVSPHT